MDPTVIAHMIVMALLCHIGAPRAAATQISVMDVMVNDVAPPRQETMSNCIPVLMQP